MPAQLTQEKYSLQGGCCVVAFVLHKLWGSIAFANEDDPVHGQQQHQLHPPHPRQQQKRPCPRIGLGQHVSTLWSSRTTSTQFHLFTTFSNIHVSSLSNCEMRIIFNWMMNSCLCRLTFFFMDLPLREGTEAACVYFKVEVHRQPLSLITRTQFQLINGARTIFLFLCPWKKVLGFTLVSFSWVDMEAKQTPKWLVTDQDILDC